MRVSKTNPSPKDYSNYREDKPVGDSHKPFDNLEGSLICAIVFVAAAAAVLWGIKALGVLLPEETRLRNDPSWLLL